MAVGNLPTGRQVGDGDDNGEADNPDPVRIVTIAQTKPTDCYLWALGIIIPYRMSIPNKWYHVNGNTYGTWLHGDRRGWRSRHGREHCVGDYKSPPPSGMYDRLEEYSRRIMKSEPVVLTVAQRTSACGAMAEKLRSCGVRLIALSVGAKHYHILAQFPDARVQHWVGLAKKHASYILGELGLPGRVWARKCRALPIGDRRHQVNTFKYILAHRQQGSCVWTFRDAPLKPSLPNRIKT